VILPPAPSGLRAASDRKPAPDFALTDADGARISLSSYRGRVILLDFWATWCTGCKVEIPWYMEFQKKYAKRGLTSIGDAMDDEGWEKVRPYLQVHPIHYSIVLGMPDLAKPYQMKVWPLRSSSIVMGTSRTRMAAWWSRTHGKREIRQLLNERSSER
jgi:thiol-disulfide isomerase/thioredoxin